MTPWRVGILGLGRISQGYDSPDDNAIRTHIKACLAEPRFRLVAIADTDAAQASSVHARWNLDAEILSPASLLCAGLDLVCIATPTPEHLPTLRALTRHPPRLILCEKPLGGDAVASGSAVDDLKKVGCTVAVNFLRRWIPGLREELAAARAGIYGEPLGAVVHYSRGLRNNGSHGLDLVAAAFDAPAKRAAWTGAPVQDGVSGDPTFSCLLELRHGGNSVPVWMHGIDGRTLTMFSVEILWERARLVVEDAGEIACRFERGADAATPAMLLPAWRYDDDPPRLMALVWRNLADHLANGTPLACTARDALGGLGLVAALSAAEKAA